MKHLLLLFVAALAVAPLADPNAEPTPSDYYSQAAKQFEARWTDARYRQAIMDQRGRWLHPGARQAGGWLLQDL
jgi:hypothetical protein